jgi:hypothetical protein
MLVRVVQKAYTAAVADLMQNWTDHPVAAGMLSGI